jgi:aspartyl-tRNA(Asn)/glutamyl-tRNA(Gln) amidotransferase subunit A
MVTETYTLFRQRVLDGTTCCADEVERALEAIRINEHLGAFITVCADRARHAAEESDRRFRNSTPRPLEGMIVAIKDNISTRGIRTTCASRMLDSFLPVYDATVVERIQEAGAIIIGKTNLDEFAMGSSNENSFYSVARNPHNPEFVPGGSSGGSAIAVAAGMAHTALGSDTGGSIRQPAAFCGVVGFKPSYGRVSRFGLVAFASSLDQIGPLTRSVSDAALVASVISGHDPHDSTTSHLPPIEAAPSPFATSEQRARLGVVGKAILGSVSSDVRRTYEDVLDRLRAHGYSTVEVDFFSIDAWIPTYYILATAEASSNLARYDGIRYGFRADTDGEDIVTATRTVGFGPEVRRRIMLGTYVLSAGYYEAFYGKAQRARRWIVENYRDIFARCDAVILPTTPTPAFRIGEKISDPLAMYLNDVLTVSANLAGLPALSIPAGRSSDRLPIGIQLQAPLNADDYLLRIAHDIERCLSDRAG